jgi:xyloglucan fucosyltransferase
MQQRKPKACAAEGVAQGTEPELPVSQVAMARHGWPDAEGAPAHPPMPRKKKLQAAKRWSWAVNVVLIAFFVTVVLVFAGGGVAPSVWLAAAKARLGRGEFRPSSHGQPCSCPDSWHLIVIDL